MGITCHWLNQGNYAPLTRCHLRYINPKKLITSYKGLEKSGLDRYLTPKTVQEMKNLELLNDKVDRIKKHITSQPLFADEPILNLLSNFPPI